MKVYTVWCEWDIGLNDAIFGNYDLAVSETKKCLEYSGIEEPFEELLAENLVGIESKEVRGIIPVLVPGSDHSFYSGTIAYETVMESPGGDFYEYAGSEYVPEGFSVYKAPVVR